MQYLRETGETLDAFNKECMDERLFIFSLDDDDYMLKYFVMWDTVFTDIYRFSVGNTTIDIPSGFFVMCADEEGSFDWVLSDELIGRDVSIMTLTENMRLKVPEIPSITHSYTEHVYFPSTPNPVMVGSKDKSVFTLVSKIDLYHKTKNKELYDFAVG